MRTGWKELYHVVNCNALFEETLSPFFESTPVISRFDKRAKEMNEKISQGVGKTRPRCVEIRARFGRSEASAITGLHSRR